MPSKVNPVYTSCLSNVADGWQTDKRVLMKLDDEMWLNPDEKVPNQGKSSYSVCTG